VSTQLYFAIMIALQAAGFLAGRWWLIPAVVALWMLGLAIAALAGAAVVSFAALDTMLWVLAFTLGTIVRRLIGWIASHARHDQSQKGNAALR